MRRIQNRAAAALILAGLVVLGLAAFLVRLAVQGEDWAGYTANRHVYRAGVLQTGRITDRDGEVLLRSENGNYIYSDDIVLRVSALHAVGDWRGYISGAMHNYAGKLSGYSFVNGTPDGGATLALSLDADLQRTAWSALGGRNGAVLIMNYETGEILCMTSAPAYDPAGEPDASVEGLFINRCLGASFTPGSVFKLVTLIAAKENIPDLESRTFRCEQCLAVGGDYVNCTGWHGNQNIYEALANSCNCAFAELSLELGGDTLARYAEKLGVSGSLELDGNTTAKGNFSVAEPGSLNEAWSGVGQYNDLCTPYAMMRLSAAIANGGIVREPTLLKNNRNSTTRLMSAQTAKFIGECMANNVQSGYGSWTFPGLDLCAKTGTAEVGGDATHAWFTGYLQSGAPLAFAVMLERGGGGLAQAGAVANTVLQRAAEIYSR